MIGCKFKAGDRVELVENTATRFIGERGTVQHTYAGVDTYIVKVTLDDGRTLECYERRLKAVTLVVPAPRGPLPDAMFLVTQSADRIFPRRSYDTILKSLMEEMGELSTEIAIVQGTKKRAPSSDGVKGEAVDVFVVAVDMLRAAWGDALFTQEFTDKVSSKLAKWERA